MKKFFLAIWTFSLQKGWNWIMNRTTIDEEINEAYETSKERMALIKAELEDVTKALGELKVQASHVVEAAKGTKRRGRPRKNEQKVD